MDKERVFLLLGFIAIAFLPSLTGFLFSPGEWYAALHKTSWTPPNWLFGPAWTFLYITIGLAGFLAWESGSQEQRRIAFVFYATQLFFNGLWTFFFFGLHSPLLALLDLSAMLLTVLITMALFYACRPLAGLILLPYFLWSIFAFFLNLAILRLN
ncbi:MAG: hypothetical protein A2X49_14105 [Lentisphaerae bacterium GWF2_52_8]|nr:MAG: hypothetical protein A2X49_14105 [Lentisphaerae bacterium GWF2_52_8]